MDDETQLDTSADPYARTRVVKRLSPNQAGALKLARRYGSALVCVRYRHDAAGRHRYTTVELVVDDAPVATRKRPEEIVAIRIDRDEPTLRSRAYARGAKWDGKVILPLQFRTRPIRNVAPLFRAEHGAFAQLVAA
jgi:hypothetical protein